MRPAGRHPRRAQLRASVHPRRAGERVAGVHSRRAWLSERPSHSPRAAGNNADGRPIAGALAFRAVPRPQFPPYLCIATPAKVWRDKGRGRPRKMSPFRTRLSARKSARRRYRGMGVNPDDRDRTATMNDFNNLQEPRRPRPTKRDRTATRLIFQRVMTVAVPTGTNRDRTATGAHFAPVRTIFWRGSAAFPYVKFSIRCSWNKASIAVLKSASR
jgi:hypothetical protein